MGLAGTIGHFMLIEAHRLAPASRIAPFIYSQIIWMTIAGYLVFGDVPELWTFAGAVIVVACGLYLLNSERQKNQPLPVPED
jgi:drug/metabolite transporter (DMT)-like permease